MGADVDSQVIEYLSKKGYSKTESMLRQESANQDVEGRPVNTKAEETGGAKYGKAFGERHVLSHALEYPTELRPRLDAIVDRREPRHLQSEVKVELGLAPTDNLLA